MRKKTIIYEGLGFPVKLINVPIRKEMGEEVLDIDKLLTTVLRFLIFKPNPLTGNQLKFIRKFLEMTTSDFAQAFGVTHPTVLRWEKGTKAINPTAEFCIRLYALQSVQNQDLQKLCSEITVEHLAATESELDLPIEIDEETLLMAG
ncbi:MAG: hypothetical protein K940chlam9_00103 [Chlamydiae bacterium]|nr:hypothetical protein [Chlamydiota bacterium]